MQVRILSSVPKLNTRLQTAGAAPTPAPATEPTDQVELSDVQPTRLWHEAEQLGLLPVSASVPGPLGAVLSETARQQLGGLIEEFDQAGVSFYKCPSPREYHSYQRATLSPEQVTERILSSELDPHYHKFDGRFQSLVAHAQGMEAVPIHELGDLRDLEAIFLRKDPALTRQPELAGKLMNLEQAGYRPVAAARETERRTDVSGIRATVRTRPIGAFGAYRALRREEPQGAKLLWLQRKDSDAHRVQTEEDLKPISYFAEGEEGWAEADELAVRIRDLDRQGYTFSVRGRESELLDPLAVWSRYQNLESLEFTVGVRGSGGESSKKSQVENPELLDPGVQALGEFYQNRLLPMGMSQKETDLVVRILSFGPAAESLETRYQGLKRLQALTAEVEPGWDAYQNLNYSGGALRDLLKVRHPDESLAELLDAYEPVRRRVPHRVSVDTLSYLRDRLPARTIDSQDRAQQTEQILQIAAAATSFTPVERTHELLTTDWVEASFPERLEVFQGLAEAAAGLPQEKRDMFDKKSAEAQANDDYALLLRHRGPQESLAEVADKLKQTHQLLVPRLGWSASREAFARYQKLHGRDSGLQIGEYLSALEGILNASPEGEQAADYDAVLRFRRTDEDLQTTSQRLGQFHHRLAPGGCELAREIFAAFQRRKEPSHQGFLTDQATMLERLAEPFPEGHPDLAADYRTTHVHRPPGQTQAEGVKVLAQLQTAIKDEASTEQARKLYIRLLDEYQKGVFGEQSLGEVMDVFLENYAQHMDRHKAYALTRFPEVDAGEFKFEEDAVVIGDFELELDF